MRIIRRADLGHGDVLDVEKTLSAARRCTADPPAAPLGVWIADARQDNRRSGANDEWDLSCGVVATSTSAWERWGEVDSRSASRSTTGREGGVAVADARRANGCPSRPDRMEIPERGVKRDASDPVMRRSSRRLDRTNRPGGRTRQTRAIWYSQVVPAPISTVSRGRPAAKKARTTRSGSDGTRTRDLRRDRPAL
jgi:hypothetical protein